MKFAIRSFFFLLLGLMASTFLMAQPINSSAEAEVRVAVPDVDGSVIMAFPSRQAAVRYFSNVSAPALSPGFQPAAPVAYANPQIAYAAPNRAFQDTTDEEDDEPVDTEKTLWEVIKENWMELAAALLLLGEMIARWTPTTVDNAGFRWLRLIFDSIVGNRKREGGSHPTPLA